MVRFGRINLRAFHSFCSHLSALKTHVLAFIHTVLHIRTCVLLCLAFQKFQLQHTVQHEYCTVLFEICIYTYIYYPHGYCTRAVCRCNCCTRMQHTFLQYSYYTSIYSYEDEFVSILTECTNEETLINIRACTLSVSLAFS